MTIYGRAWFERDEAKRLEVLRQCCTDDVVFVDDGRRMDGVEEVSAMIGQAMNNMAGSSRATESTGKPRGRTGSGVGVEVVTAIEQMHGFFRYSFVWTVPGGDRFGGTDFGEFAPDGRMRLITVWPGNEDFPVA
jgi:hypothetical protein